MLRGDAVANRERILAAAEHAFRERGMAVDMRAVAAAAGVGVGTLYRHFPAREHLVQAVAGTDLADLAGASLPEGMPAMAALRAFFTAALARLGQEAVDRSRTDHTLAVDVPARDIAYQLLGLVRVAPLIPDGIEHEVELALRALAAK